MKEISAMSKTEGTDLDHLPSSSSNVSGADEDLEAPSGQLPKYITGWRLHIITASSVEPELPLVMNITDKGATGFR